jgi:hypothetical protein
MRLFLWTSLMAASVLLLSCGDSTPSEPGPEEDPIPGWLRIRLISPNSDDGGILFTVAGGQVDSIRSGFPDLYVSPGSTTSRQVLVAGNLATGGVVAELLVPNVKVVANYTATVQQVAARATFQQRQASTVTLVVER